MAGKTIGRNSNTNDGTVSETPVVLSDAITLNSTTSVKIADVVEDRIVFVLSNPSGKQIWLKFQPAADDDDKKGISLFGRSVYEMPTDNIYTGEISAISDTGSTEVYVTEY